MAQKCLGEEWGEGGLIHHPSTEATIKEASVWSRKQPTSRRDYRTGIHKAVHVLRLSVRWARWSLVIQHGCLLFRDLSSTADQASILV